MGLTVNAGVMLLRPLEGIHGLIVDAISNPRLHFSCFGDQDLFGMLFSAHPGHMRCLGQSFNCRDSAIVHATAPPSDDEYRRSLCHSVDGRVAEAAYQQSLRAAAGNGSREAHAARPYLPSIIHFAVNDKPWVGDVNRQRRLGGSFFYPRWHATYTQLLNDGLVEPIDAPSGTPRVGRTA